MKKYVSASQTQNTFVHNAYAKYEPLVVMFFTWFSTSDFQGRAQWDFSATCVSTPVTVSTERPVTLSPGNASRTASSGGAGNPPVRYVGPLSETLFKNHIENLIKIFFYT